MSYRTFEVTETGAMLPVTAVYMTNYELEQYNNWKNPPESELPVEEETPVVTEKVRTNTHKNFPSIYHSGTARLSREHMDKFLKTKKHSRNDESVAKKMNLSVYTVKQYTQLARKYGLI